MPAVLGEMLYRPFLLLLQERRVALVPLKLVERE